MGGGGGDGVTRKACILGERIIRSNILVCIYNQVKNAKVRVDPRIGRQINNVHIWSNLFQDFELSSTMSLKLHGII